MKVLISFKTTNLSVLGEDIRRKVSQGRLDPSYLERLIQDDNFHHGCRKKILSELDKQGIVWIEINRGFYWPDLNGIDAIISVGGDGTVLEASHHIHTVNIPLIGVKSSPMSVGQLCCCNEKTVPELLAKLKEGQLSYNLLPRLQAHIISAATGSEIITDPILNDFLFTNAYPAATTRYSIKWQGEEELHKSSGLWISTAVGSSAAIEAAGGERVSIKDKEKRFQFVIRELYKSPLAAKNKLIKGFFNPENNPLNLENLSDKAILALDGQHGLAKLGLGDQISFQEAPKLSLAVHE